AGSEKATSIRSATPALRPLVRDIEPVELLRIAVNEAAYLVEWQAAELVQSRDAGIGPVARRMRVVGGPHDLAVVHVVAELEPDGVDDEGRPHIPVEELAGQLVHLLGCVIEPAVV